MIRILLASLFVALPTFAQSNSKISLDPKPVAADPSVKLDYDIVYVRAPRKGDAVGTNWPEIANPTFMDAGADLMLLHPDGTEEVLVKGGEGSVTDPMVSFDGESVYYSLFHSLKGATTAMGAPAGADIYRIHVKTKRITRLTQQIFTPNTGAGPWSSDYRKAEPGKNYIEYGVFNMGPCPLPGGKVMFTSNRNAFKPSKRLPHVMQLFTMDDDGKNVECIGHLNLGMALHPTMLQDGRVMFSSLESQGLRSSTLWGLWQIHPDGTNWGPLASAFSTGNNPSAWHFQTQLSDGSIVAEEYYSQTSSGFGGFVKFPATVPEGNSAFGPGYMNDPRNPTLRHGRLDNGQPRVRRFPFTPFGSESITPFARTDEGPADFATAGKGSRFSPRVGKVTHPSGAPYNHLLLVWSAGPVNGGYTVHQPAVDGGIYLMKRGKTVEEPGELLLVKNDPKYNEQWPRALVPYKRIHGIDEPKTLKPLANDGSISAHLPAGTPFGLIGTSSFYKRESYPNGVVKPGTVTADYAGSDNGGYRDLDPFNSVIEGISNNWINQGGDAGRYTNADIHAVRILAMEPTSDRHKGPQAGRGFRSHATEKLKILGEIPLRKYISPSPPGERGRGGEGAKEPLDPDGNPDTSFLAKIPADVGFTFQMLDKRGMVLNMAQTWHQVRPGEMRVDCGGCHAHSQKPTDFKLTLAAKKEYDVFDLTKSTPIMTTKAKDESGKKWDAGNTTGLKMEKAVKNVEYYRDIVPIINKSCASCHTGKESPAPGNLVLDNHKLVKLPDADDVPESYYRLAMDFAGRFGHKPLTGAWRQTNASRYVRMFQSRRSLLVWKIFGERLDGFTNDDFPTETTPGNPRTLQHKGQPIPDTAANRNLADLDYTGSVMPPPDAVKSGKVKALTDEDKLTIVRWIDLGCPIDLTYDAKTPQKTGLGWMLDDQRPTLTVQSPKAGINTPFSVFRIGMHDYGSGLDMNSLSIKLNIPINGQLEGAELKSFFKEVSPGVLEWDLILNNDLPYCTLTVSIRDKQGNTTRIERSFRAK